MRPILSILLPFRDAAATLDRAVASMVGQSFGEWELFLLDDGSTDPSGACAARWAAADERVRLIALSAQGIVAALNVGIERAQGDYLFRMDADDVAHPDRLARQVTYMEAHPEVGLCGAGVRIVGGSQGFERYEGWINGLLSHDDHVRELFVECPIPHPTFCLRREAVAAVGGYREGPWPEDYDLVFRLWQAGWQFGKVPEILLDWHDSTDRLSRRDPRYSPAAFRALKRTYLMAEFLQPGSVFYQWGAGEVGKPWLREWDGPRPEAVVDIRPGKIGQRIHGYTVIRPEDLPPSGTAQIVIAVGTPGARDIIREWLEPRGYRESTDFVFVA